MKTIAWAALAALLFSCTPLPKAVAGNLHIGQISHHFVQHEGLTWREKHPLIMYEDEETNFIFGYFKNSYNEDSFVLGKYFFKNRTGIGDFSIKAGLVSGYEQFPAFALGAWRVGVLEFHILPTQMVSVGFVFKL